MDGLDLKSVDINKNNCSLCLQVSYDDGYLERYSDGNNSSNWLQQQSDQEPMMIEDFAFLPDFTDALLARLTNQPFAFPDPREIGKIHTVKLSQFQFKITVLVIL